MINSGKINDPASLGPYAGKKIQSKNIKDIGEEINNNQDLVLSGLFGQSTSINTSATIDTVVYDQTESLTEFEMDEAQLKKRQPHENNYHLVLINGKKDWSQQGLGEDLFGKFKSMITTVLNQDNLDESITKRMGMLENVTKESLRFDLTNGQLPNDADLMSLFMNVYQDLNSEAATTLSQHLRFFRHGGDLGDGKNLYFEIDTGRSKEADLIKGDIQLQPLLEFKRKVIGKGGFSHQVQAGIIIHEDNIKEVAIKNIKVTGSEAAFKKEAELDNVTGVVTTEGSIAKPSGKYGIKGQIFQERGKQDMPRWLKRGLNQQELLGVFQAIKELHDNGKVNQDIKEENVVQVLGDSTLGNKMKLIDRGLEVSMDATQTATKGSYKTMAPESANGQKELVAVLMFGHMETCYFVL